MVRVCVECEHVEDTLEEGWYCHWFQEELDNYKCDNCPLREVVERT